ncbi:hypothetical protein DIPPA_04419 [Diplonema papillatum]|nr:hypothetical protein DIPPA_04419 [Diplonema papillatum]
MAGAGRTMFVAGGSGFIGSNLCKEAVRIGFNVVSLSRTGRPGHIRDKWADQVDWIKGDVLKSNAYVNVVREVDAVVSCIGKFGAGYNNAVFEANADTNIFLAQLIHRECPNISKYGYISAQEYSMRVQKPFRSYFSSKQKAEKIIQSLFPKQYLILRPNWVYGWKHVAGPLWFPWQAIGAPIERILHPIADYCTHTKWVVPPTPVEELAHVLALGCTVGRDVSGYLPTMRVRDVIEREAQGRPLDDYLKPYILQVMKDRKEYFENVNYVEKYGLRNVGHKSYELAIMDARGGLNPALKRNVGSGLT